MDDLTGDRFADPGHVRRVLERVIDADGRALWYTLSNGWQDAIESDLHVRRAVEGLVQVEEALRRYEDMKETVLGSTATQYYVDPASGRTNYGHFQSLDVWTWPDPDGTPRTLHYFTEDGWVEAMGSELDEAEILTGLGNVVTEDTIRHYEGEVWRRATLLRQTVIRLVKSLDAYVGRGAAALLEITQPYVEHRP